MIFSHKLLFKAADTILHATQIFLCFLLDFMCNHCMECTAPIYRFQLPSILAPTYDAIYIVD